MFRYVGLIWNVDDENQCAAARLFGERLQARARQWGQVGARNGLSVFHPILRHGSLHAQPLKPDGGVLLGSLFHRNRDSTDETAPPRFVADREQSEQILASRGRWLIDNVWGNYVAILRDPASRRSWVLKDPSGNLPCFRTSFRGVTVLFAHIADVVATGLLRFSINGRYLANRVLHGGVQEEESLDGVQRIYRGECVELGNEPPPAPRVFYWHPQTFARSSDLIEDPAYATRAIRAIVRSCTHTLTRDHASILHRLSGGLDSSIIAACLAQSPQKPRLHCYTYYSPGGRSDERPWARLAAGRNGLKHQECPVTAESIQLASILDAPAFVEPAAVMGYIHRSSLEERVAREHEATAVFSGDGGDSSFCGDTFAYAVSEYLRRRGLGLQALRLAARVAAITEESSWTVAFKSLRRWLNGAGMEHQRKLLLPGSRLLSDELRASHGTATLFPHPWFSHSRPIPWSLVRRLGALLAPPEFYNVAIGACAPEVIAPLYSQPATELFLRIPLDVHFHDGKDRGLARQAFAQDLPPEILRRTWKDRAPGFLEQLVQGHRRFLRELLLDGVLVQEGLLNRVAIEDALSDRVSGSPVFPGELLRHLDVEAWARRWRMTARAATGTA